MISYYSYLTPIGTVIVTADEEAVVSLQFEDQRQAVRRQIRDSAREDRSGEGKKISPAEDPESRNILTGSKENGADCSRENSPGFLNEESGRFPGKTGHPVLAAAAEWLELYFSGKEPDFLPPLRPEGTAFQKCVWGILLEIPYGETKTYGEIARQAAEREGRERMSAQAAGQAAGRNPIALMIPCHRVVGAGGRLTGYAAGVERKAWLLDLERKGKEKKAVLSSGGAER